MQTFILKQLSFINMAARWELKVSPWVKTQKKKLQGAKRMG